MPELPDREKRRSVFCQSKNALKNWETGKEKTSKCDTPVLYKPIFFIPEEGPVVRISNSRPDGIILFNQETSIGCSEVYSDSVGDLVTVPFGQYYYNISYSDIPDITESQLYYIGTLDQTSINESLSVADLDVIRTMKLSSAQQAFLVNEVALGIEHLTVITREASVASLSCRFESDERTFCCDTDFFIQDNNSERCFTLPQGYKVSTISKEAANARTAIDGNAILESCVIGNDEVTAVCPEGFYVGEGGGIVTIPKGFVTAASKEVANKEAAALADASLSCVFCNDTFTLACPTGSITASVEVSDGSICRNSPAELAEAIEEFLASFDVCQYQNKETLCNCKELDPTYDHVNGEFFTVKVFEGEFVGDSQLEVDTQAKEECLGRLDCQWCSDIVFDPCDPNFVLLSQRGEAKQLLPFCDKQSSESKQAATADALMSVASQLECPGSCKKPSKCLNESDASIEFNNPDFGAICKVELDEKKKEVFSWCVSEGVPAGGGGGGGGKGAKIKKRECAKPCNCMSLDAAIKQFGKDNVGTCDFGIRKTFPCATIKGKPLQGIPNEYHYCFKKINNNNNNGPGGQPPNNNIDNPLDGDIPQQAMCPEGCICVESPGIYSAEHPELDVFECENYTDVSCNSVTKAGSCIRTKTKEPLGEEVGCPEGCLCVSDTNRYADRFFVLDCPEPYNNATCGFPGTFYTCKVLIPREGDPNYVSPNLCPNNCICGDRDELEKNNENMDVRNCPGYEDQCDMTAEPKYCYSLTPKYTQDGDPYAPKPSGSGTVSQDDESEYYPSEDQTADDQIKGNEVDGKLIWANCDGTTVTLLEWVGGLIITPGNRTFIAGCDGTITPP